MDIGHSRQLPLVYVFKGIAIDKKYKGKRLFLRKLKEGNEIRADNRGDSRTQNKQSLIVSLSQ